LSFNFIKIEFLVTEKNAVLEKKQTALPDFSLQYFHRDKSGIFKIIFLWISNVGLKNSPIFFQWAGVKIKKPRGFAKEMAEAEY